MHSFNEVYLMHWHSPKEYREYLRSILKKVSKKTGIQYYLWESFADDVYEILFVKGHDCIRISEYSLWRMEDRTDELCQKINALFEEYKNRKEIINYDDND